MNIRIPFLATALAVAVCPAPGADAEERELEPLIVTAARIPVQTQRVTQSLTIITREEIERRQAVRVVDVLRDVPGVSVSRAGSVGAQTQLRMRGAEANHTLVMIDGIEANDPANGDDFRFEYLMAADVERIEIVRGPQSALWGTDALAGVINIITRPPSDSTSMAGTAYLEAGSHATVHGGANLGFAIGRLNGLVSASHFDSDGTNIARQGMERDGTDNTTVTASLEAEFSDRAGLDALFRHVDATSAIDAIDFLTTGLPTDALLFNEAARGYGRLNGFWTNRKESVDQSLTLTFTDTHNENFGPDIDPSSSAAERAGLRYQATWQVGGEHYMTAAMDFEGIRFSQRGTASAFGDPNQDQDMDQTGVVLDYVGYSGDRWDFNLSARYDHHSDFRNVVTARGALGYELSDHARMRVAAGSGRKAPTFTERFGFFPDQFVGNPDLEPEESRAVEVGYEHEFAAASLSITWFDQDLEDEINGFVFDPAVGLFTAANQEGEARRTGIEFAAAWRPLPGLSISANYTYTDATEQSGGRRVDEIRRPRHAGTVNLNYASRDGFTNVNLNINHNGSQLDTYFPPFPEPARNVRLDDHLLVDLAASRRLGPRTEVFGRINNLLDEDYEQVFGFANPGRTAMAGIRYRFGP